MSTALVYPRFALAGPGSRANIGRLYWARLVSYPYFISFDNMDKILVKRYIKPPTVAIGVYALRLVPHWLYHPFFSRAHEAWGVQHLVIPAAEDRPCITRPNVRDTTGCPNNFGISFTTFTCGIIFHELGWERELTLC